LSFREKASTKSPSAPMISPTSAHMSISMMSSPGGSRRNRCGDYGRSAKTRAGSYPTSTSLGSPSGRTRCAGMREAGCTVLRDALRYRDDWCVHAWKRVQVPAWMIEHPELIAPARISDMFDPVPRNSMIEIMTPERFVKTGTVSKVAEDETGVLWRKSWSFRGVAIGSRCAVEVVNRYPEPDGSRRHHVLRVPSSMRTAREAVAWTYSENLTPAACAPACDRIRTTRGQPGHLASCRASG
jgi:hypothetical protein